MTELKPAVSSSKALVVCHMLWAGVLIIPFITVMLFPDQVVDNLFDWLLVELPEIHGPLSIILWILLGFLNLLIILAVMSVFLIFRIIAIPLMIVTCLPSIIGVVGAFMKKKWGMKFLLVSGVFSLLLVPVGSALGIWTIISYRRKNRLAILKPADEPLSA